jgi:hypothetical protein
MDALLYKSVDVSAKPGQKAFNRMFFESINECHEHVILHLLSIVDFPLQSFDGRDLAIQELIGTGQAEMMEEEQLGQELGSEIPDVLNRDPEPLRENLFPLIR